MTILDQLMDSMKRRLEFTATTEELRESFPGMNRGSMSSALSRAAKNGILTRVERGVYKIKQLYRMFRHTKRVRETHTKKPQRSFDLDVETTSEGFVPAWKKITEIESVLNPKLIDVTLTELAKHGYFFIESTVEWQLMGSEWLDERATKFDPDHVVEIVVINNSGTRYLYKTGFKVRLNEFE